jgi:hypothetical protein
MQRQRSGVRLPSEFRALARDVRAITTLLNDYLRETDVDISDTMAAMEYREEPTFADDQVINPVTHVQLQAHHSLVAAIDHLGGVAACIAAENITLAPISLMRPIVVASGVSYWLLDPDITLRERLRRGWNLELDSIREQLNSITKEADQQLWQRLIIARHRYLTWAEDHGYQRQERKERYGERRYWLSYGDEATPPPAEIKLAEAVLSTIGAGGMGKYVYRFTSAFIHTQPHAFSLFKPARTQYDPQTPGAVPLGIAYEDMTTWLTVVTLALNTAAERCGYYFGWDMTKWSKVMNATMSKWVNALRP